MLAIAQVKAVPLIELEFNPTGIQLEADCHRNTAQGSYKFLLKLKGLGRGWHHFLLTH
jgi:hypothetical protein